MKVYKYDNVCMIAIDKQIKNKLLDIKHRYKFKNISKVVEKLLNDSEELNYYTQEPYEKYNS